MEVDPKMGEVSGSYTNIFPWSKALLMASPKQYHSFGRWEAVERFDFMVSREKSKISDNHSRLHINGEEIPELTLYRNHDYYFTYDGLEDDEQISFAYTTLLDGSFEYSNGIEFYPSNLVKNHVHFRVPEDAPDYLYYHSSKNKNDGNLIKIFNKPSSPILNFPNEEKIEPLMLDNYRFKAVFIPDVITLRTSESNEGTISFAQKSEYLWGEELNITAQPINHWSFSHWISNAEIIPEDSPNAIITLLEETELSAVFKRTEYPLNLLKSNDRFGDVYISDNKSFAHYQDKIEINANPRTGKLFKSWTLVSGAETTPNTNLLSSSTQVEVNGPVEIIANFESQQFDINVSVVTTDHFGNVIDLEGGTVKKDKSVYYDEDNASISFIAADGYELSHWVDESGTIIGSTNPLTVSIRESKNLTALAKRSTFKVSYSVYPAESGLISFNEREYYFWGEVPPLQLLPKNTGNSLIGKAL